MQVVVITGIAQGMGRETAKLLAGDGYGIAGFDVDGDGIESLRAELPGDPLLTKLDVTDLPGIAAFRDQVLEHFGHVDTVLSNVGIGFFGPFEEVDLAKAAKCLEINVIGTAAVFQAFVPHMRERRAGKLIAVSSLVGQIPFPFESIYSASKFAVEGLVLSMRLELAPFGIKTALIQPAQVSTSFAAKIHTLPAEGSPYRERVQRFINKDEELIKTAPTPLAAAKVIAAIVKDPNPSLHNQIDAKSKFFMAINKVLPTPVRDMILLQTMDIK
jgi:NAD(P)-dependent dehydrogenase (short-subunit alcohol dehydrogenase family)